MEVVLDVNVFVSAVLSGGGPFAALVAAMRGGRLSAVASNRLLIELGDVLRRDRFRPYLSLEEVDEYVAELEDLCRIADDPYPAPEVLRDPDDDYLVALATDAGTIATTERDVPRQHNVAGGRQVRKECVE